MRRHRHPMVINAAGRCGAMIGITQPAARERSPNSTRFGAHPKSGIFSSVVDGAAAEILREVRGLKP